MYSGNTYQTNKVDHVLLNQHVTREKALSIQLVERRKRRQPKFSAVLAFLTAQKQTLFPAPFFLTSLLPLQKQPFCHDRTRNTGKKSVLQKNNHFERDPLSFRLSDYLKIVQKIVGKKHVRWPYCITEFQTMPHF